MLNHNAIKEFHALSNLEPLPLAAESDLVSIAAQSCGTASVLEAGYKIKWSKFIAIAGVAIIGAYLLRTADIGKIFGRGDTHGTSPEPSQTEPKNVTIGRFKCSAKDSAEVKRLTPLDTQGQLETDKADLQAKGRELAALQVQIEAAPSNGVAGQDRI